MCVAVLVAGTKYLTKVTWRMVILTHSLWRKVPSFWGKRGSVNKRHLVTFHPQSSSRERWVLVLRSLTQSWTPTHGMMTPTSKMSLIFPVKLFGNTLTHEPRGENPR